MHWEIDEICPCAWPLNYIGLLVDLHASSSCRRVYIWWPADSTCAFAAACAGPRFCLQIWRTVARTVLWQKAYWHLILPYVQIPRMTGTPYPLQCHYSSSRRPVECFRWEREGGGGGESERGWERERLREREVEREREREREWEGEVERERKSEREMSWESERERERVGGWERERERERERESERDRAQQRERQKVRSVKVKSKIYDRQAWPQR